VLKLEYGIEKQKSFESYLRLLTPDCIYHP
jgi:hypothetical protein